MKIVSIEGAIGAGKSTLLRALAAIAAPDVLIVQEPIAEWQTPLPGCPQDIFSAYYHDPHKYAFAFQWFVCVSRMRKLHQSLQQYRDARGAAPALVIVERSIFADREIFMKHLHASGNVNDLEMAVYDDIFAYMREHETMLAPMRSVDAFVYLRAAPERCEERVHARARDGEVGAVNIDFLRALHERHEAWLVHGAPQAPVITVDVSEHADNVESWSLQKARDILDALTVFR